MCVHVLVVAPNAKYFEINDTAVDSLLHAIFTTGISTQIQSTTKHRRQRRRQLRATHFGSRVKYQVLKSRGGAGQLCLFPRHLYIWVGNSLRPSKSRQPTTPLQDEQRRCEAGAACVCARLSIDAAPTVGSRPGQARLCVDRAPQSVSDIAEC